MRVYISIILLEFLAAVCSIVNICDQTCENRAFGLKYTMSFDETYLNTEIMYLEYVRSVVKPNKLSTNR